MMIMIVDNCESRLTKLRCLLNEIYPDSEFASFTNPFFAGQYSVKHNIDAAFIQQDIKPIDGTVVLNLIHNNNINVKIFLIADNISSIENIDEKKCITACLENPVSKDKLEKILYGNNPNI